MSDERTIGFNIKVNGTETEIDKLTKIKIEIRAVEERLNALNNASKGNTEFFRKNAGTITDLQTQLKGLRGEYSQGEQSILKGQKANDLATGSYNELSAQLYVVSSRQKELTAAEREDASVGGILLKQRVDLVNQLKDIDEKNGVFTRNVGNYSQKMTGYANTLRGLRGPTKLLGEALGIGAQEADQFRIILEHSMQGMAAFGKNTGETTELVKEQTIAEKILNAVKSVSLFAWVAIAGVIVAAGVAIYAYITSSKAAEAQEKLTQRAVDGTIIANKELRESYNKTKEILEETNIDWKIHKGVLTEVEGAIEKLAAKNKSKIQEIKNDTQKEINETTGLWAGLKSAFTGFFTGESGAKGILDKQAAIEKEGAEKIKALKAEEAAEALKIKIENTIKEEDEAKKIRLDAIKNAYKDLLELDNKFQQDALKASAHSDQEKLDQERIAAMDELQLKVDAARKAGVSLSDITRLNNRGITLIDEEFDQKQLDLDAKNEKIKNDLLDKNNKEWAEKDKKEGEIKIKNKKDINDAILHNEKLLANEIASLQKELIKAGFDLTKQGEEAYFASETAKNARDSEQRINHLTDVRDTELASLQARLTTGAITDAQFKVEKKIADDKFRAEELKAKKAAFEDDKRLKKQQVALELVIELARIAAAAAANPLNEITFGAAGVAQFGVQGGIAVGRAAIQYAVIENSKYEYGGVLKGKKHSQGGIPFTVNGQSGFEAEDQEILLTKGVYQNPQLRNMASRINVAGGGRAFALGGPLPYVNTNTRTSRADELNLSQLGQTIIDGINAKPVTLLMSDLNEAQKKLDIIESESTF